MHNKLTPPARLAGELLVIVVGVLIALSADSWVSERNARRVEAARVAALRTNVDETLSRLAEARAGAVQAQDALRELASFADGAATPPDSVIALGLLYGTGDFHPELNVYDDLKSSGELALLTNTELRQALAKMDATLERVRLYQADLLTVQQLNYDRFVLDHLDLVRLIGPHVSIVSSNLAESRPVDLTRISNLAVFKLNMVTDLIRSYDEASSTLEDVLQSITVSDAS